MKKLLCIIITVLTLVLGLTACGDHSSEPPEPDNDGITTASDCLVAYFSCTDNTRSVAEKIAEASGASLYRIVPEVAYTSADLDYADDDCRANKEQNDKAARPAISGGAENISQYGVVFIGYPIWWGRLPKIIYTFLDAYDLSDKTVVPFCTSGGSGISASVEEIRREEPYADVLDGRRFASDASRSDIADWVNGLNLKTEKESDNMQFYFTVGETRLSAELEDNAAVSALKEKLKTAPLTIEMSDYGGWEKVGNFGFDLPTSDKQITAQPCDFVLYQGNRLVVFYGSNSWSYTRLGRITGVSSEELKTVLGRGDVTVTLSLSNQS